MFLLSKTEKSLFQTQPYVKALKVFLYIVFINQNYIIYNDVLFLFIIGHSHCNTAIEEVIKLCGTYQIIYQVWLPKTVMYVIYSKPEPLV